MGLEEKSIVGLREARIEVANRLHAIPHHEEDHDELGVDLIYIADTFLMAADQNVPWIVTREEVDLALKAMDEYVEPFLPGWFESETPISLDQARSMADASGVFFKVFMGSRLQKTVNRLESIAKEAGCGPITIGFGIGPEEEPNRLTMVVESNQKIVIAGRGVAIFEESLNVDLGYLSSAIYLKATDSEKSQENIVGQMRQTTALLSTSLFGDDLQIQAYMINSEEEMLSTLPVFSDSERIEESLRNFFADLCGDENPSISGDGEGGKSSPSGEPELMIVCPPVPEERVDCEEDPEA